MDLTVTLAPPGVIRPLRDVYRAEMNCQIVHDSWYDRGWTDSYLFQIDGRIVGYGLVGGERGQSNDTIIEFFVLPADRAAALPLFCRLAELSQARSVKAQTNDRLLLMMLLDCAVDFEVGKLLFYDAFMSWLELPGAIFRQTTDADREHIFTHQLEPVGDWLLEAPDERGRPRIVATGGVMTHYNPPYGDLYMEVDEPHRRHGYGAYLVQKLKRACYDMGRIPAARCDSGNVASRATLQKAGMLPCARLLTGLIVSG